tara:strand:+ start:789 stop:1154 length:366 start_codon:yes stop_codon:yes gene_type:complete
MNEIFNLIADINYTGPNIYRRMNDDKERFDNNNTNNNSGGDGGGGGGGGGGIMFGFISLFCAIIFMYAQYILLKCYCGKYVHFLLMTVLLGCCPLCTLPYLFYNHFANKCGKGQIGKPPKY